MAKYIEEYLVALGFDLNSAQGKEYLKMCDDLEKRQKELERAGKAATDQENQKGKAQKDRIVDSQKEIDLMGKMKQATEKFSESQKSETVVKVAPEKKKIPPKPAPTKKEEPEHPKLVTHKEPTKKQNPHPKDEDGNGKKKRQKEQSDGQKEQINLLGSMEKAIRDLGQSWTQLERGNIFGAFQHGASGVRSFSNYVGGLNTAFGATNTRAGILKKTLTSMFGTASKAAGESSTALSGASEAGAAAGVSGLAVAGAAAGIAVGVGAAAKGAYGMADGFAKAAINVETMARQLWITDSAAYQLQNTLSAMGKTTADLNEIALNPTLNAQFKALQEQTKNQDMSGIKESSKNWNLGAGKEMNSLGENLGYLGQLFGAKMQDWIGPAAQGLFSGLNSATVRAQGLLGGKTDKDTSGTYAPQSASYINYAEGAKIEYSPKIEVNARSDSAHDIADATSDAVQQSFQEAALIKNLQGLSR